MARNHPVVMTDDISILTNYILGLLARHFIKIVLHQRTPEHLFHKNIPYFKSRKEKCCTKMYLEAFQMIYGYTGYSFDNIPGIARRLCNCFFKAFVKRETDKLKKKNRGEQRDTRQTKRKRLSAKD